jgi:hypothetical protein
LVSRPPALDALFGCIAKYALSRVATFDANSLSMVAWSFATVGIPA